MTGGLPAQRPATRKFLPFGEVIMYNDSISKGEYPQQMKVARVISLYKKGANTSPTAERSNSIPSPIPC